MTMLRNTRYLTCLVAVIGALTAFQPEVSAEPKFSGRVFFDANNNGRWDEGEAGVADAAVTDGVQVVRCGADGRYELELTHDPLIPHQPTRVISVSWPSGTWPSGPWFRRLRNSPEIRSLSKGLKVVVRMLDKVYQTGRKYAQDFKQNMTIKFDEYLPKWNYTAIPDGR